MQWEEIPVMGVNRDTRRPPAGLGWKETLGTEVNRGTPSRHRLEGDNWDSGKQGDPPNRPRIGGDTWGSGTEGDTQQT